MTIDTYNVQRLASQNGLEKQLEKGSKSQEELKEACEQFEAYFLEQMFKEMRKSVPESGLIKESHGEKIFKDMLYQEYAKESAKTQSLGLAQMLFKQLSNNNDNENI